MLTVDFPGGATVTLTDIDVSVGRIWVKEDGRVAEGWSPPDW